MKNVLQRLLLISAIALVAIGANAHVITECWVTTTDIPGSASGGEFRFASAKDGKIITIDKANKKIMAIDKKILSITKQITRLRKIRFFCCFIDLLLLPF